MILHWALPLACLHSVFLKISDIIVNNRISLTLYLHTGSDHYTYKQGYQLHEYDSTSISCARILTKIESNLPTEHK